ncbi:helix-turn-helix domain-containing protein [Puia sp. P3]|uniref:helix-turn-helix domain-containing protein n=1 Tax=Puia sp. P3 TaxID=3423952 RepID=UPI003D67CCAC
MKRQAEGWVSRATLSKIEEGRANFRILTITKLCNYYHVTFYDLLNDPRGIFSK